MILEANERELQALAALIDAAVRSVGIRGAGDAVLWIQKIEEAIKAIKSTEVNTSPT